MITHVCIVLDMAQMSKLTQAISNHPQLVQTLRASPKRRAYIQKNTFARSTAQRESAELSIDVDKILTYTNDK